MLTYSSDCNGKKRNTSDCFSCDELSTFNSIYLKDRKSKRGNEREKSTGALRRGGGHSKGQWQVKCKKSIMNIS